MILPLKLLIDQRPDPGRYLLTGSSDLLRVPGVSDSLAGRTATAMLRPLTQGELAGRFDDFIDRAMSGDTFTHHVSSLSRANYVQRALDGGFPGLSGASNRTRRTILDDYSTAVLYRSLNELSSLTDPGRLPRLLRLLAARSSQEINRSDLARDLGSAAGTIDHLLDLLMTMHLLEIIPSWSTNRTARTVRRPKSVLIDTALICNLLGIDAAALDLTVDPKAAGPILESFVINELLRQAAWSESRPVPAHYRTHDGAEIDLILETPSGKVMAIEIKTSAHVTARDIGAMTAFAEKHQSRFIHGFVLYTGTQRVPFGPRITALPIDALWCGRPS